MDKLVEQTDINSKIPDLNYVIDLYKQISKENDFDSLTNHKKSLHEIINIHLQLKILYDQITQIKDNCQNIIDKRVTQFKKQLDELSNDKSEEVETNEQEVTNNNLINPDKKWSVVVKKSNNKINVAPPIEKNIINKSNFKLEDKEVAPGLYLKCVVVDCEQQIPQSPLYFVKSTQKFAVPVFNKTLSGNIGEIFTYEDIRINGRKPFHCDTCRNKPCNRTICGFLHPDDPKSNIRNYVQKSWFYARPTSKGYKEPCVRHIGNRSTLKNDLNNMAEDEGNRVIDQAMHDLLLALVVIDNKLYDKKQN